MFIAGVDRINLEKRGGWHGPRMVERDAPSANDDHMHAAISKIA